MCARDMPESIYHRALNHRIELPHRRFSAVASQNVFDAAFIDRQQSYVACRIEQSVQRSGNWARIVAQG